MNKIIKEKTRNFVAGIKVVLLGLLMAGITLGVGVFLVYCAGVVGCCLFPTEAFGNDCYGQMECVPAGSSPWTYNSCSYSTANGPDYLDVGCIYMSLLLIVFVSLVAISSLICRIGEMDIRFRGRE